MIDKRIIADPRSHYGSGKAATHEFRTWRITGAINILWLLFLVWLVVRLAGAERAEMVSVIGNPFIGIIFAALIVNVCMHMRIGMREIIIDYLDEARTNRLALMLNDMIALGVGLVCVLSILKIVIWG